MGPICSTYVHSQIHPHYMCTIYSQSVQPFDHISQAFELLTPNPPPLPQCRRGVSWGELFLAYAHSQTNPQTCTEFGAIGPSRRLAAFPDLDLGPPKTTRNAPCGIEGRIVFIAMSIPRRIRRHVPTLVPIGRAFDSFPRHLNL